MDEQYILDIKIVDDKVRAMEVLRNLPTYRHLETLHLEACSLTDGNLEEIASVCRSVKYLCLRKNALSFPWHIIAEKFEDLLVLDVRGNRFLQFPVGCSIRMLRQLYVSESCIGVVAPPGIPSPLFLPRDEPEYVPNMDVNTVASKNNDTDQHPIANETSGNSTADEEDTISLAYEEVSLISQSWEPASSPLSRSVMSSPSREQLSQIDRESGVEKSTPVVRVRQSENVDFRGQKSSHSS
ncbi:unnamed protein product [Nippostrongylus brasiliensis]|uniref:Adenylate cyclase n=1 Tax=Nippostrongylus brasiliensis TaxID=27835 RepID=A0A0N4YZF3_NIPBR|nr:unnamed protein product [Nippostrongylus brasiliensis]